MADESLDAEVSDGRKAVDALAAWLQSKYRGGKVLAVGHRVVHGGSRFTGPAIVDQETLAQLRELIPLAPLHQPYNLAADRGSFSSDCPVSHKLLASIRAFIVGIRQL